MHRFFKGIAMQDFARSLFIKIFSLLFVATILTASFSQTAHAIYISPDDWDPTKEGVGTNRYAYSQGDPINRSDRNGHQSDEIGIGHNGGPADDIRVDPDDYDFGSASADPLGGYAEHQFENRMKSIDRLMIGAVGDMMIAHEQIARSKITGFGQQTGKDTWHADVSYKKAMEYAKDPNVASVHLNRSLTSVLGKDVSKVRPDITVVYKDGTTVRVCECVSATQTKKGMDAKNAATESKLSKHGYSTISESVKRGEPNDPTGGVATGEAPKKK
jgi:hypothetical protein